MKYLIANWKAHKTIQEVDQWISELTRHDLSMVKNNLQLIICPPYPFIHLVKERLKKFSFCSVGAQDVSYFGSGAYTGEVTAENLAQLVDYVLIGHSERRKYFDETATILFQKTSRAIQHNIKPIFCIRDRGDMIPSHVPFVAYEPVAAVGTGNNEPLENVLSVKKRLRLDKKTCFIYGGSVNIENISKYISSAEIDGLLVGAASLQTAHFFMMARQMM